MVLDPDERPATMIDVPALKPPRGPSPGGPLNHPRDTAFGLDVTAPLRGTTTVVPRGELDLATAPELEGWLEDLRRECADVIIDLSEVTFLDSSGLRVLLRARREAQRMQTGLRIEHPTRNVRRAIEAAGLTDVL